MERHGRDRADELSRIPVHSAPEQTTVSHGLSVTTGSWHAQSVRRLFEEWNALPCDVRRSFEELAQETVLLGKRGACS